MKTLIVCQSYHHGNMKKIADAMATVLHAEVVSPREANGEKLDGYDLVGFGSGIAFGRHYKGIHRLVDKLPTLQKRVRVLNEGWPASHVLPSHLETSIGGEGVDGRRRVF